MILATWKMLLHQASCHCVTRCKASDIAAAVSGVQLRRCRERGFTLVELVTIMVIVGVLAAVSIPRFFDRNVFESRGFHDQLLATLRYAQKAAIAQHGYVCVAFAANNVTLTTGATATCGTALIGLDGQAYVIGSNQTNYLGNFNFDPLGRPSTTPISITVNGYADKIVVEQETGYVHSP